MDDEAPHYLLDSNIISEIIKLEPSFAVIKKLSEHAGDCAICAPTWHELLFGVRRLPDGLRKRELEKFIKQDVYESFPIQDYTADAATIHAELRAKLEARGTPAPFGDSMIAAVALAQNMVLATRNVRHFAAIAEASLLQLENWFEE